MSLLDSISSILSPLGGEVNGTNMPKRLPIWLTKPEKEKLLDLDLSQRDRAIVTVFLYAGLRANELRMLDVADFDFEAMTIHIRHAKRGKERVIPLHPEAAITVDTYLNRRRTGPVFLTNRAGRISYDRLHSLIVSLGIKAGLRKHTRPHVLRHSFAVALHENDVDLETIRDLLGHEDIRTTSIYLHCSMAGKRLAVDRL
jgi:integrase/recombinase XerC